jgi:hypothetical protein
MAAQHIIEAKRDKTNAKPHGTTSRPSLFHQIVHSDMPESELSAERLVKEAQLLLGAGTASMARTLDFIIFYILAKPDIHARLQDELRDTMAEYPQRKPSWAELERLPYLQAIIKEGLRLSYGIMRRLPRCSPDVAIQYKQWTIPRNVSPRLPDPPVSAGRGQLTVSAGARGHVGLPDAHRPPRLPKPLRLRPRPLAQRGRRGHEAQPGPLLPGVAQLPGHEVSRSRVVVSPPSGHALAAADTG